MTRYYVEEFGLLTFDNNKMKKYAGISVYNQYIKVKEIGGQLDIETANGIANGIRNWALENGVTYFSHWFQPLTGITAGKHESIIDVSNNCIKLDGFDGKALIKGESDASSFPNGGLRSTFEARGYTVWDINSFPFIKEGILYIPTVFCAYGGEALDKKTPLLRSMNAINKEAVRILSICGMKDVKKVYQYAGVEQEFFLIDKQNYDKRKDLIIAGRTLFGAKALRGQKLNDHYFGIMSSRVQEFFNSVNDELWKLGIIGQAEHNEVASSQYEIAVKYSEASIACDQNQIIMELLDKTARKHGMVCILTEKPFEGLNGSGKHNNWSLGTDTGKNLLYPGESPKENLIFLLFVSAIVKAVDEYQDLLRASVASSDNDNRLGGNEAPPVIVSVYLGEEITNLLESIANSTEFTPKEKEEFYVGVANLPRFIKDISDRNRTSPFAFTGNKFEFRMLGSSDSIACANMMINAAVASVLSQFSNELEGKSNINDAICEVIKETFKEHKKIIFNGDGYSKEWIEEAKKRGLLNLSNSVEAINTLTEKKNVEVLTKFNIMSENEIMSRQYVLLDNYCKKRIIEAKTMVDMTATMFIPSIIQYCDFLLDIISKRRAIGCNIQEIKEITIEKEVYKYLSDIIDYKQKLYDDIDNISTIKEIKEESLYISTEIVNDMKELRKSVDLCEKALPVDFWPVPRYDDILYNV